MTNSTMIINRNNKIQELNHEFKLGILEFSAVVQTSSDELWAEINTQIKDVESAFKLEQVNAVPAIAATRKFYKLCGKDPSRYRPAADSLLRRIIKGNGLYKVNNVVDILNLISIKSGISVGGYNTKAIKGEVILDIGTTLDKYRGIGRGELNIENLPVLRDEIGVFGSPTSDSERTLINDKAEQLSFVFFDFGKDQLLCEFMNESKQLLETFAEGKNFRTNYF